MAAPTLSQYRKLWEKVAADQRKKALALGLGYIANIESGLVVIELAQRKFEFDGLPAAGTALDMLETERQPHV